MTIGLARIGGVVALAAALVSEAEEYYSDGNRALFFLPASAATGYSDLGLARDGAPNSNAANLPMDTSGEVTLSYAGFYGNTFSTSSISYVTPIAGNYAAGVSLSYLLIPDIKDNRRWQVDEDGNPIADPSLTRIFSASEQFLCIGGGRLFGLSDRVRLGVGGAVNAKRSRLTDVTGYGIGVDAGVSADFVRPGIRAGLSVENITTNYVRWEGYYSEKALPHVRLGVGWQKSIPYIYGHIKVLYASPDLLSNEGVNAVTFADEVSDSVSAPLRLRIHRDPQFLAYGNYGLEYCILGRVSLRGGLQNLRRFTFGAGLVLFDDAVALDLTYLPHDLSGTYAVSATYRWN